MQQRMANPSPHGSLGPGGFDENGGMNPGGSPAPKRRRWYLGIQSKKEPAHVMSEVYKALFVLHFEWKVVAPYRIKCRWQAKGFSSGDAMSGKMSPQLLAQSQIKVGLQLYKVQQHIYLLDFQRLEGNAFIYMNLCARIITELKTLSGIRPVAQGHDPRFGDAGGMGIPGGPPHHHGSVHMHPHNPHQVNNMH
jgi:5'-AMP-activated protein kinase catalytic alpha subunit